ncbi:hypothetical protein QO002_001734 [Pararhizobium capsulatum DSM 1112]|uniref:Uncharacterized protein n=1 Tax=Pararhizobium capsulatum DSM 1112 TaxID=1121113 RepID=A0ABU0BPJ6_9HYPH|nr:hypothetical protein [Pararhizobium capsulatum]MDQ0319596.1 hypothetical protein [Pararhizobium capsulatum DSM 1112]
MQNTGKTQSENTAATMPQHLVDRFESEWRQMRAGSAEAPKSAFSTPDKR